MLQPLQALEHPAFKKMINVAARATSGVKIPNRKATRNEVVDLFKRQMTSLKAHLNVRLHLFCLHDADCIPGEFDPGQGQPDLRCMAGIKR